VAGQWLATGGGRSWDLGAPTLPDLGHVSRGYAARATGEKVVFPSSPLMAILVWRRLGGGAGVSGACWWRRGGSSAGRGVAEERRGGLLTCPSLHVVHGAESGESLR
jgi:hypothetical protein